MVAGDDVKKTSVCAEPRLTAARAVSHIPISVVRAANTSLAFRTSRNDHKRAAVAAPGRRSPPERWCSSSSSPTQKSPDMKVKAQDKENVSNSRVMLNKSPERHTELTISPATARKRKLKHQDIHNSTMETDEDEKVLKELFVTREHCEPKVDVPSSKCVTKEHTGDTHSHTQNSLQSSRGLPGFEVIPQPTCTGCVQVNKSQLHSDMEESVANNNVVKTNGTPRTFSPNYMNTVSDTANITEPKKELCYRSGLDVSVDLSRKTTHVSEGSVTKEINCTQLGFEVNGDTRSVSQTRNLDPSLLYSSRSRVLSQHVSPVLPGSNMSTPPFYLPESNSPQETLSDKQSFYTASSDIDAIRNKSEEYEKLKPKATIYSDKELMDTSLDSSVPHTMDSSGRSSVRSDNSSTFEDSQTHSLPPVVQSSYNTIQQHKLPPKKRRLYYEQDLSGTPAEPTHTRSAPGSPRSTAGSPACQSLPANFDPLKSQHMALSAASIREPQKQDSGYLSWPVPSGFTMSIPPIGPNGQFLYLPYLPGQMTMPAGLPYMNYMPVAPNAVQDLSKSMAALLHQQPEHPGALHTGPVPAGAPGFTDPTDRLSHTVIATSHQSIPLAHTFHTTASTNSMPAILEHSPFQKHAFTSRPLDVEEPEPERHHTEEAVSPRDTTSPKRFLGRGLHDTGPTSVSEKSAPFSTSSTSRKRDKAKPSRSKKHNVSKKSSNNTTPGLPAGLPAGSPLMPSPPSPSPVVRLPSPARSDTSDNSRTSDRPGGDPATVGMERHLAIEPDEDGDLPLHIAVVQNEPVAVKCLVDVMKSENIAIDYHNNLKQTPLHLAVITKLDNVVKLLLEAGASPNIPDRKGQTCCHLAISNRATSCLKTLVQHSKVNTDLNAKNYEGLTPLHRAVQLGDTESVSVLLGHGADINLVDGKSGKSPLYLAFECNQPKVADLLLAEGADVNIPTYSGSTVLQAANPRGQHLLNHLMGRGEAGSAVRDLQNKLTSKVNRSRQKTMGSSSNKNNKHPHVTNDGSKSLGPNVLTVNGTNYHVNGKTSSNGRNKADNGNKSDTVTMEPTWDPRLSPKRDSSGTFCQISPYHMQSTEPNVRTMETPMET